MDSMVLGIDASGARCGFALVSGYGPRLIWQTTVHTPKSENPLEGAYEMNKAVIIALEKAKVELLDSRYDFSNLVIALEDPSAFAYATALHHTSKTTNPAAVFGFPWTLAIVMLAIGDVFGYTGIHVHSYQPSQWQSKLGVKDFYAVGAVKEALQRTYSEAHPERNKKDIIRAVVATVFSSEDLMETRLLRSGRHDWVVEQDGVDAAGIAYVGMREHLFGAPASKAKKKQRVAGVK
jgi:hypothetical protein